MLYTWYFSDNKIKWKSVNFKKPVYAEVIVYS